MRAAVVSHTYVEPANRGKLEALARRGVAVTAFVPATWEEAALAKRWAPSPERSDHLEIVPVPVRRFLPTPAAALWDLRELRDRLARSEIDVLQVEEEPWSLVAWSALRCARRRSVTSTLFTWENLPNHPRWPFSGMARRTLRRADGWIAGNESAQALLGRISPTHPSVVLPQLGVAPPDAVARTAPDGDTLRIAFVGRLVDDKGVADLMDAVAGMRHNRSLSLVGDGPCRTQLEIQARQLGVAGCVTFHGAVAHADVAALWPTVDVLVLPSRTTPRWAEQFGHVLVEAMAHGVAVVGSSSGAIPEVIGDAGLIVPERDPGALRKALDGLAADRSRAEALGRRGRNRVERLYTDDAVAEGTIAFWKTLGGDRFS